MDIGFDTISVIAFFALVGVLLIIDRKNIEFNYGLIIRRWKHGQYVMDKWIFNHKKFLQIFGTIGFIIGFGASVFGLASIIQMSLMNQQAVSPILPTVGGVEYPSSITGVPFWFWIISIFVVLTVHEPMHAIFARLAGVPVRSWGIMTFLVVPIGAFVDPDMKKVQKLTLSQKLRVFAGGSFGNFITAGIIIAVMLASSLVFLDTKVTEYVIKDKPAQLAGVEGKLIRVDGVEIKSPDDLTGVMTRLQPGTVIEVITDKGSWMVTTTSRPDGAPGAYLGIGYGPVQVVKSAFMGIESSIVTLFELFRWLIIFNLGIGIFNMMPMKPFDGGHMFEALFAKVFKSDILARRAIHITSLVVLGIILFNVFGTNLIKSVL